MSEWSGMTVNDAARVAEDRAEWREIMRAANPSRGGPTALDDDDDDDDCYHWQ